MDLHHQDILLVIKVQKFFHLFLAGFTSLFCFYLWQDMHQNYALPNRKGTYMDLVYPWGIVVYFVIWFMTFTTCRPYDPEDDKLHTVLTPKNKSFEAFYPREAYGVSNGLSRPAHGHGSFYKFRNPALVDAKNSPAYGFRFDGYRRFNFD